MTVKRFPYILLSLLFAFVLSAAEPFSELDIGRILFISAPDRTPQSGAFVVFERVVSKNLIECHRYGSQEKVGIAPGKTAKMIYFEDSSPFHVTQLALYCILRGQEHLPVVELAEVFGDTSGRVEFLKRYQHVHRQLSRALGEEYQRRIKDDTDVETSEENLRQLLEDSELFSMAKKAAEQHHDFMLAVVLAQGHFRLAARNYTQFFPTAEGRQQAEIVLRQQKEALMELYRAHFKAGAVRRERFRALCPRARGLWSEAPAVAYGDLLKTVETSMASFAKLDDLSSIVDFQEWGTAMLNVLLLVENSKAARELEVEFDQVIAERTPPKAAAP